ncbi:MAG: hypothetical protein VB018_04045 [Lachnospiraceae bacterium]|nr:hypothetical protein [Lachnospiraceae bacterium]
MARRRKRKTKIQTMKIIVFFILINAEIDLQLSYFLAYLGRENIAEALSKTLIVEVIGVVLVYAIKSYSETKQEKNNQIEAAVKGISMNNESEEP